MKIQGTIHLVKKTRVISEKFRVRELIVIPADNSKYPQYVPFQVTNSACESLDEYEPGQLVEIEFQLRGREWTSPAGEVRYFGTNQINQMWKIGDEPSPATDDEIPF